uniref:Ankyrin repeat protein n=1 Tax=Pithovirus LCPAC406 TaxID=2506599 RepID=A0A481ZFZ6_9VIRU|nr:MAG: ankyrin repeat protein [Pithovirus LCPAC406]
MEILKSELKCKNCEELIFEFLINGNNYTPFAVKDLKLFSKKIKNWDVCMKWGVVKDIEFIEYCESMIHEKLKKEAYIKCMIVSSKIGNLNMLKYFESKGIYKEQTWIRCFNVTSLSEKYMLVNGIKKEDTFEICKYVETKIRNMKYHYVIFIVNKRIDILEYLWNQGYNTRWSNYMRVAAKNNHLEILKWIESKISEENIKWDWLLMWCTLGIGFDTYKYCRSKYKEIKSFNSFLSNVSKTGHFELFKHILSEYEESKSDEELNWRSYLSNVARTGNLEMFKFIVAKDEESGNTEKLTWEGYARDITTTWRKARHISPKWEDFLRNGFNLFKYCAERSTSLDYLGYMLNAMSNGFHQIASFCKERLDPGTKIDWESCMTEAVYNGSTYYIEDIVSEAGIQWNWKKYIRNAACWDRLEPLKYIEEKMNERDESIDWKKLMEASKEENQNETEVTVYIQIKLEG